MQPRCQLHKAHLCQRIQSKEVRSPKQLLQVPGSSFAKPDCKERRSSSAEKLKHEVSFKIEQLLAQDPLALITELVAVGKHPVQSSAINEWQGNLVTIL